MGLASLLVNAKTSPEMACAYCQLGLGLVEQIGVQVKLEAKLTELCAKTGPLSSICEAAVKKLTDELLKNTAPDILCHKMNICVDNLSTCKAWNEWPVKNLPPAPEAWPVERRELKDGLVGLDHPVLGDIFTKFASAAGESAADVGVFAHVAYMLAPLFYKESDVNSPCKFNITCHIEAVTNHLPLQDGDADRFGSVFPYARGTNWRGTDCNDRDPQVYPGASNEDSSVDKNCNGIYGRNDTGSYEDLFCAGTGSRGLIMLGDSATAHFHVPPQWLTADGWNLDQLVPDAMDELDVPQCSWGTGHVNPTECPLQKAVAGVSGVTSIYSHLRSKNRCNNNDFQNIGVNGARMPSAMGLINAMARVPSDKPVLLWLSLIGNDVCNGHPNFDGMTTPEEFYEKTMEALNAIDARIPKGSYVVSLALFDGVLLYDTMHNRQHPLGGTYTEVYDFLNCLEISPCWGWLNSNETVRHKTQERANALNDVYTNISQTAKFNNFEYVFIKPAWATLFGAYEKNGGHAVDLIEPTDGFHPSQTGNAMLAEAFVAMLEEQAPGAMGTVNPHNAEIDALFFKA